MEKLDRALFGAAYYCEYLPCGRLEKDIEMMLHAGINVVRIGGAAWDCYEPGDGVFDFSCLEKTADAMGSAGISVIVSTPVWTAPAWLARQHPGILSAAPGGRDISNGGAGSQIIDILSPEFRAPAGLLMRAMLKCLKDKPAVIGYQAGSELDNYANYGDSAQKGFVQYLKGKFGTAAGFSDALGPDRCECRFSSWDDIPPAGMGADAGLDFEYHRYLRAAANDCLVWESGIIDECRGPNQFITHSFCAAAQNPGRETDSGAGSLEASKCLDVAGAGVFHPTQDRLTGAEIAFSGDLARSLKHDNYFILETQSQDLPEWTPYPGQLRLQAFSHFASGSNMVEYSRWSSAHGGCCRKGLLGHDFESNPVYEEAAALGADLGRIGSHIVSLRKKNDMAFVMSSDALAAFNARSGLFGTSYGGVMRLMYDAAYRLNLECDFSGPDLENIERCSVLFVPALYSASDAMLEKLNSYVKSGGCLIAGFASGFADENLRVRDSVQPGILSEACGISCSQSVKGQGIPLVAQGSLRASAAVAANIGSKIGEFGSGAFLRMEGPFGVSQDDNHVDGWMDLLKSNGAEILAGYDHPVWGSYGAVSLNRFGKGFAAYIGCMCSPQLMEGIIKTVLVKAGIRTRFEHWPVIRRNGINALERPVHYYLNYSSKTVTVPYEGGAGRELLGSERLEPDSSIELGPWAVKIVEENRR